MEMVVENAFVGLPFGGDPICRMGHPWPADLNGLNDLNHFNYSVIKTVCGQEHALIDSGTPNITIEQM
jgi:hypothetical protein